MTDFEKNVLLNEWQEANRPLSAEEKFRLFKLSDEDFEKGLEELIDDVKAES